MDLTRWSIQNDRVIWLLLLAAVFVGTTTFLSMPRSDSPPFTVRNASVITHLPGASPERIEELVTTKVETAVRELPELDFVSSTSKAGISIINVAIKENYTDMRPIWDDLRLKVDDIQTTLPEGASSDVQTDLGDVYEVTFAMTGEGIDDLELKRIAEEVRDAFLLGPEVAKVEIVGVQEPRVFVEVDNARIAKLGLSPSSLRSILAAQNITASGGEVRTAQETLLIEPSGSFESIEELENVAFLVPGRQDVVVLKDIATVRRGSVDPVQELVRINGERAISVSASMRKGGDVIAMGHDLNQRVDELQADYPIGIEFVQVVNVPENVQTTINDFVNNLLQAIAAVLLVMLIFLGMRTGLVVVTLVPMTMLVTLGLMGLFDIGLHQVSLAALIIALGMLVDNAIVMAESILVRMQAGESPVEAAVGGANELRVPLLIASLTTSAAFLPIALAESAVGEFTVSLFQVVSLSLASSWLLSVTMIPFFCVLFIKVKVTSSESHQTSRMNEVYRRVLGLCLRNRWAPLTSAVVAVGVSVSLFAQVPANFFPDSSSAYFSADVELPTGTPISYTTAVMDEIDDFMRQELAQGDGPRVLNWGTYIGQGLPAPSLGSAPGPANSSYAGLRVTTNDLEFNNDAMQRLEKFVAVNLPDAEITVRGASNGPPVSVPIEIRVYGREVAKTFEYVEKIKAKLREIEGTRSIQDDWGMRTKKLQVDIGQDRARRAGITHQDVAMSLNTTFSGLSVSEFREGEDAIPVMLRSNDAERIDLDNLATINVQSQTTNASVPLVQLADLDVVWEYSQRMRRDGLITVAVSSELEPGFNAASLTQEIVVWLDEDAKTWQPGYSFEVGGENESSAQANQSIMENLPLCFLVILGLLILQFNSVRRALIVLSTIPMALIGVIPGLLLFQQQFGFMTLLGVISLAGIVINNAIVLLDRIRIELDDGDKSPTEAIIDAAAQRVRPILLTTVTTVSGMVPLYLGGGALWESMAVAIMCGLTVSTVLTLLVIPTMYAVFFRVHGGSPVTRSQAGVGV